MPNRMHQHGRRQYHFRGTVGVARVVLRAVPVSRRLLLKRAVLRSWGMLPNEVVDWSWTVNIYAGAAVPTPVTSLEVFSSAAGSGAQYSDSLDIEDGLAFPAKPAQATDITYEVVAAGAPPGYDLLIVTEEDGV